MAAENVQTFTDTNSTRPCSRADSRFSWTSGPNGVAPANGSVRPSMRWPREYAGKVTVGKLNVDENQSTAIKFQIRGIPSVLLFKGGQIVESVVGLAAKEEFKKVIDKHI